MLSNKQVDSFQNSDAPFNIWIGAVRSGKTYSSILRLCDLLQNGPEGDCMLVGVTRDSIQRNILSELFRFLGGSPPASKSTETKLFGRNIYFVGANDESSVRRIQGSTLAMAYVDEATCIPAPFWRMLISRLSIKGALLLATCNPEGPAHWLKKEYIDRATELKLKYWNFTLEDNPSLDADYVTKIKASYTGMWYKRYILGEWAAAHGLIYDSFDDLNVTNESYNPGSFRVVGIDYGTTNATCALIAEVSPTRWPQIRIVDEYYYDSAKTGRSKTDAELADDIVAFLRHKDIRSIYIDPAAASFKLELRRRDLPVVDANNDVMLGIKVTSKFIGGKNLVIHQNCTNLLEQVQSYAWDPKAADRGEDKPLKIADHAADALRYLCVSTFPTGELHNLNEGLTIEQIKRQVYGEDFSPFSSMGSFDYC